MPKTKPASPDVLSDDLLVLTGTYLEPTEMLSLAQASKKFGIFQVELRVAKLLKFVARGEQDQANHCAVSAWRTP